VPVGAIVAAKIVAEAPRHSGMPDSASEGAEFEPLEVNENGRLT
jgi:hypothetical protein